MVELQKHSIQHNEVGDPNVTNNCRTLQGLRDFC